MRRPSKTKAQRAFDKTQRALLRLRKAVVTWAFILETDTTEQVEDDSMILAHTTMQDAALSYYNTLTNAERRRLLK